MDPQEFSEEDITILSSLTKAVRNENIKDVKDCLRKLPQNTKESILNGHISNGRRILHYAVKIRNTDIIKCLLNEGADPNAIDDSEQTPLHYACSADEDGEDETTKIVNLLLEKNASIEATDSYNETPLHKASENGNADTVEILLQRHAEIYKYNKGGECPIHLASYRGHISVVKRFFEHDKTSINKKNKAAKDTPLHYACEYGDYDLVAFLLKRRAKVNTRNTGKLRPLHKAAEQGHDRIVSLLIERGKAKVNVKEEIEKKTPLDLACANGNFKVVQKLLEHNAEVGKHTLKDAITSGSVDCAMAIVKLDQWNEALKHVYTVVGSLEETTPFRELIREMPDVAEEVLNRCVEQDGKKENKNKKVTFNYEFMEDFQKKRRSQHASLPQTHEQQDHTDSDTDSSESDFSMEQSKKKKSWVKVMFIGTPKESSHENIQMEAIDRNNAEDHNDGDTVILIENSTEDISQVHQPSKGEELWGPIGFKKSNHPLAIMVESEQLNLLKHPVVGSLLHYKWRKFGQYVYFFNLFTYIIFLTFLTAFALVVPHPLAQACLPTSNATCESNGNVGLSINSTDGDICNCSLDRSKYYFLLTAAATVVAMSTVRLLMEIAQLVQLRLYYFIDWTNWIEVSLFICSIIFVWIFHNKCLCPFKWQWQIGIVAIFLAWITLIAFIQKFPLTGIYVLMFLSILFTYMKAVILFILLVVAFGLTFYMTFYEPLFQRSPFSTTAISIVKALSMTGGDFDFDSVFHFSSNGDTEGQQDVPFLPVAIIFWILFIILMPILLINMLVGLAVDDIKGIQEAAALKKLALQVELVLNVEELLPWRRHYVIKKKVIANKLRWYDRFQYLVWGGERYDTSEVIDKIVNKQTKNSKKNVSHQDRIKHKFAKEREDVLEHSDIVIMKTTLTRVEKVLKKLAEKQNISDSEDDHTTMID